MNKTEHFTFHETCSLCLHLLVGIAAALLEAAEKISDREDEVYLAEAEKEGAENE